MATTETCHKHSSAIRWWKNRGNLVIRLPGSFWLATGKLIFNRILKKLEA